MKGTRTYIACLVVAMLAFFAIGQRMPRRFTWSPTYHTTDRQPFGCYVFDSVMRTTMPHGYSVEHKTFAQIVADSSARKSNILVVANYFDLRKADITALDTLLARGSKVILAIGTNVSVAADSVLAHDYGVMLSSYDYFSINYLRNEMKRKAVGTTSVYDTIEWRGDETFAPASYRLLDGYITAYIHTDPHNPPRFTPLSFSRSSSVDVGVESPYYPYNQAKIKRLEQSDDDSASVRLERFRDSLYGFQTYDEQPIMLAARLKHAGGSLLIVSTPLFFTNYGVLDPVGCGYLMRLMTEIADRPVIRTTAYSKTADELQAESSPMRVFFAHRSLKAAYYMLLFTLLLFCVFKARRRQRVIPVVEPPRNRQLEFAQLIGTLYHQRGDNADLVRKKYQMFAEQVRSRLHADIFDHSADSRNIPLIARHTGIDADTIAANLRRLRLDYHCEDSMADSELQWAVDCMENMTKRL